MTKLTEQNSGEPLDSVVVAERRRFFLTSSIPLIEILQNHFFRLHNCNNHTTLKFHRDSQVDLPCWSFLQGQLAPES